MFPHSKALQAQKRTYYANGSMTGGTLTREEKDWITREVNHNTYFKDSIPLLGYRFNFVDVLKTFVVKQYGHYTEYKGVDKTSIRSMLYGRVERIVEL